MFAPSEARIAAAPIPPPPRVAPYLRLEYGDAAGDGFLAVAGCDPAETTHGSFACGDEARREPPGILGRLGLRLRGPRARDSGI